MLKGRAGMASLAAASTVVTFHTGVGTGPGTSMDAPAGGGRGPGPKEPEPPTLSTASLSPTLGDRLPLPGILPTDISSLGPMRIHCPTSLCPSVLPTTDACAAIEADSSPRSRSPLSRASAARPPLPLRARAARSRATACACAGGSPSVC